jgi:hypothetical protein
MARDTAWLIETGDHKYWNGKRADQDGFTHDPNDAVRFARFEDSERVIYWLLEQFKVFLVSREHAWLDGAAQKMTEGAHETFDRQMVEKTTQEIEARGPGSRRHRPILNPSSKARF